MSAFTIIALLGSAASVVLAVATDVATYRVAPAFLIPIIWVGYAARGRLCMKPFHFAMLVSGILLHNLGALGWYQKWPLNFSFDILVHFYFALAAGFVLFRAIECGVPALRAWQVYVATLFFIMGCGAIHELIEYLSTLVLGEQRGMLKTTGYKYDTQRDLLNNLLGAGLALILIAISRAARGGRAASRPGP